VLRKVEMEVEVAFLIILNSGVVSADPPAVWKVLSDCRHLHHPFLRPPLSVSLSLSLSHLSITPFSLASHLLLTCVRKYSPRSVLAIYLMCDYYLIVEVTIKHQDFFPPSKLTSKNNGNESLSVKYDSRKSTNSAFSCDFDNACEEVFCGMFSG
jgi:hypothetical protein